MFTNRKQKKSPQACGKRPSRGQLIEFTAEESKASCRADGVFDVPKRYSGGILAAVRPCGVVAGFMSLMSPESPTHAYLSLRSCWIWLPPRRSMLFYSRSPDAHASFVSSHIALLWYDCACTFRVSLISPIECHCRHSQAPSRTFLWPSTNGITEKDTRDANLEVNDPFPR